VVNRILLHGATGSGKSTAAVKIGERLGIPVILADEIGWLPGWVQRDREEQHAIVSELTAGGRWVADSAWTGWTDLVVPRAELIVGLDYPRMLSLWRLVRRTARRAVSGELVCNGNRETFRQAVGRDSIIVWHFKSWKKKRRTMRAWAADPSAPPTLLFRRPRELEAWIAELTPAQSDRAEHPSAG
jgi:adenylate kinase family enzyme